MTTELHTLLGRARDELGAPHAPEEIGLARVVRTVRRRRTQRHAVESVVGVAAAGAVGVAGWAGLTHEGPPPPAHTPSPSVSASPSPTSTPSSTPTPSSAPTPAPTPTSSPGLPASLPLPEGLLTDATPGWVLAVYRPAWFPPDGPEDWPTAVANVVYLISPTGDRYRALDLPLEPRMDVEHWRAGDTRALVAVSQADGSMSRPGWLDLRDGSVTPVAAPESSSYVGTTASGSHLWIRDDEPGLSLVETDDTGTQIDHGPSGYAIRLDPTGRRAAWLRPDTSGTTVLDLETGERHDVLPVDRPWPCRPVSWVDATQLLLNCYDYSDDTSGAVYSVDASRADATPSLVASVAEYGGMPGAGEPVGDGRVVAVMSEGSSCPGGVSVLAGREHTALPLPADFSHYISVEGGRAYVASFLGCSGDFVPTTLSVFDLDGSGAVELGPLPDPPPSDESGIERAWADALTSWTVGTDR